MIDRLIGDSENLRAVFEFLAWSWPYVFTATYVSLAIAASAHVVLYKRDVRAAVAWAGLIWLSPIVGSILYIMFGINRIKRRASRLRTEGTSPTQLFAEGAVLPAPRPGTEARGAAAAMLSGAAFWAISGIWLGGSTRNPNYAVNFASWFVAFLPGFACLLLRQTNEE